MTSVIRIKKERLRIILLLYLTLLVSTVYYIKNFGWEQVDSFKPAIIVWPVAALVGFLLYFLKYSGRCLFLDICAFFVIYNVFAILLLNTWNFSGIVRTCIYAVLWFALLVLFFNDFSKHREFPFGFFIFLRITLLLSFLFFMLASLSFMTETSLKTLNPIFYLLYFLPFVLMDKNRFFKVANFLMLFVATIFSYKRTVIIILVLLAVYYMYRSFRENEKTLGSFVKQLIFFGVVLVVFGFLFVKISELFGNINWFERLSALEETGGGARVERWRSFFVDMSHSRVLEWVFGHGTEYLYYHNDAMQIFYDYGMVGLSLYIVMCFKLVAFYRKMAREKFRYTTAFGASLIIFFFNSAVGQVIVVPTWFLQMAAFWGVVIGCYYRERRKVKGERPCQRLKR